jgi:type IV secretory pathway VirB10-like protein
MADDPYDGGVDELTPRAPAPKISNNDPSLQVQRPRGRQLRKGSVVVAVSVLVACLATGVAVAKRRGAAGKPRPDDSDIELGPPVIPESILNAPERLPPKEVLPDVPASEQPAAPSVPGGLQGAAARGGHYSEAALRQRRIEEFWKARGASVLAETGPEPEVPATVTTGRAQSSDEPTAPEPAAHQVAAAEPDGDQNLQQRKNEFLSGTSAPGGGYLRAAVRHPRSPYELKPGTVVPAVLETAINSDLPGPVIARVRENICDTVNGDWLLIPQGSTLIAYYDSMVAWGQERVLVCWKQLELPNGDSLDLGCMPAADATGQAGLNDQVDEHWWRIIKGAAVASLLSAATTAAAGNTAGYNLSVPQLWAHGAASQIGTVGEHITRRNIMIQPTLTIRQGMPVNVIVTKTIDFRPDGAATPCRPIR